MESRKIRVQERTLSTIVPPHPWGAVRSDLVTQRETSIWGAWLSGEGKDATESGCVRCLLFIEAFTYTIIT